MSRIAALASIVAASIAQVDRAPAERARRQSEADTLMEEASHLYLRYFGDPVLERVAEPVTDRGLLHPAIIPTMRRILDTWRYPGLKGVGIAAPQIGALVRIIIGPVDGVSTVMVNPRLLRASDEKITMIETCMSVPGYRWSVQRAAWVDVEYDREDGQTEFRRLGADTVPRPATAPTQEALELMAADARLATTRQFEARVFQHEVDHLNGIEIVPRAMRQQRRAAERCVRNAIDTGLVR